MTTEISEPGQTQSKASPAQAWWIWTCWLERHGGGFTYGCAAPTFRKAGWAENQHVDLAGVDRAVIRQKIIDGGQFKVFRDALDGGEVNFDSVFDPSMPHTKVRAKRTVLQEGLGQTAVVVGLYYTMPAPRHLLGDSDAALVAVLSLLQDELNFPFKTKYAPRLGNFEIFQLNSWLDRVQPFLIETKRKPSPDRWGPETMEICRTAEFATVLHMAHVVGRAASDVVLDQITRLPPGVLRVSLDVPEALDQFEFRLFGADGAALLHSENRRFMNRVGFVLAPLGREMTLNDDLSNRAAQSGSTLAARASTVVSSNPMRSMVGAPAQGTWRKFAEDMEDLVDACFPKAGEDRWFPRGVEGEVGAIGHLNQLLSGGEIRSAVLVDPFFGAHALRQFALRLGSQNIHLVIVTSWATVHPDTGEALDAEHDPTEELRRALDQAQPFLNPRLSVINLAENNEQAFHDRYLLLYPHEGSAKVFMLSNSINRLAGKWPFSMSLFSQDVGCEIQRYIEGLCDGNDIARDRQLTVTFRWPSNAP